MVKVSIFKNYSNATPGKEVDLSYVLDKIKTGALQTEIDTIREMNSINEEGANDLKKQLAGVTFCGIFTVRKKEKLIRSTGLAILDFDALEDISETREKLKADPFVYAIFVSPRGNGLKALVKIPEVNNDTEFKGYFFTLLSRFPEADPSGKDISRLCFMSYDPDLYLNEASQIWNERVEQGTKGTVNIPSVANVKSDFKKISIGLAMIDRAEVGNRNTTILKAGRLMGGFVAAGEVNELDVLDLFERAISNKDQHDEKENFRTFRNGLDHGKLDPIKDAERQGIEAEVKLGKIDYTIEESNEGLDEMFEHGYTKGYSSGWSFFDKYYSVRPGFTTYIYGAPFTGKSKWWFNVLVNMSVTDGLKHVIYSPETGSATDVYAQLIQIYGKGDVTNTFNNRMTKERFDEAKNFVGKHFIIISTDETDTDLDVDTLLDYVDVLENKYSTKIHTVTIDPWNELEHDDESRDIGLNKELRRVRINARKKQRHICLITHIRDQKSMGVDEHGTAVYPFPTARDVAGGQVWYRKGFMMLAFYRHFVMEGFDEVKIGKDKTFHKLALYIRVQKSKPEGVGRIGEVEFRFDPVTHRFSSVTGVQAKTTINKIEDESEVPF